MKRFVAVMAMTASMIGMTAGAASAACTASGCHKSTATFAPLTVQTRCMFIGQDPSKQWVCLAPWAVRMVRW